MIYMHGLENFGGDWGRKIYGFGLELSLSFSSRGLANLVIFSRRCGFPSCCKCGFDYS